MSPVSLSAKSSEAQRAKEDSGAMITLASYPRAIVHVDCDAFFASCEQARQPALKGRPLVTGKERGIISSASYEAKAVGIKRGVQLSEAKKICPELVILPSDYETYSIYSKRLFDIIRRFTPSVEESSIDEAFFDLTGLRRLYRTPYEDIARAIKLKIHKELDITVSVGLSLSKTLAKICSRCNKPDGFKAVAGYELREFLKTIPLEMVCGFGPNTVALLTKCGMQNILDYVERPVTFADKLLGKIGVELWRELRGEAVYQLCLEPKEKYLSISKSKTFVPPSKDRDFVKAQVMRNLESAFMKLRRHKLNAKALAVYLRTGDFRHRGLEAELDKHSSATLDFTAIAGSLFKEVFEEGVLYRASGVVLSKIADENFDTRTLFDNPAKIKRLRILTQAVDDINDRYGKYAVHIAAADKAITKRGGAHPRNNLPWRREELLKGETFRRRLAIPMLKLKSQAAPCKN